MRQTWRFLGVVVLAAACDGAISEQMSAPGSSDQSTLAPMITSFTAAPGSVSAGSSAHLSWTVTNAPRLSISPDIGDVSGLSAVDVTPAATTQYTLTASSEAGVTRAQVFVAVVPPNPPPCQPQTCATQDKNCGTVSDGCGGTLSCGGCTSPQTCGGGGTANVCGSAPRPDAGSPCQPQSCAAQGASCGTVSDGCGSMLACGGCTSPQTCGGGGTANVCGAAPSSGRTFYVDVDTGSDAAGGTTTASAWRHLPGTVGQNGSGWQVLQDGDTVVVKGGSINLVQVRFANDYYRGLARYDSVRVMSGHLLSPAWGMGRAVFDEQLARTYGFWIGGSGGSPISGLTVDGFEIRNIMAGGVGAGFDPSSGSAAVDIGGNSAATYTAVRRCWLHDAMRTVDDTGHGVETSGGDHLIVEKNIIGPRIGTKSIEVYRTDWGVISQNFIDGGGGDHGIVVSGNRWDVVGNVVRMHDGVHQPIYALKTTNDYNDFWNNVLFCQTLPVDVSGFGFSTANGGIGTGSHNRFVHNTVFGFGSTGNWAEEGVGIVFGVGGTATTGNEAQNNLAFGSHNAIGGIDLFVVGGTTASTIRFNDFFTDSGPVATVGPHGGYANLTVSQVQTTWSFDAATQVAANQQAAPVVSGGPLPSGVDGDYHPDSDYFRLTASTPASVRATANPVWGDASHGYSSDVNKFAVDIVGKSRSAWSMGAYEY